MFTMKELNPYFDMSATMEINDVEYTLIKVEEMSGELAIWVSDSHTVYATPYYEGVSVPVHVIDCNNQEIGLDGYPAEIESFERYCKVVQTLTAKILRRYRM
jgi:hypothetical protein